MTKVVAMKVIVVSLILMMIIRLNDRSKVFRDYFLRVVQRIAIRMNMAVWQFVARQFATFQNK
ncbi:MAG: hypothetical protein Q8K59_12970 [Nitrosomonas sp.]|nr:hypothetical protein [Nitrosomonas sp.]MDP1951970.1 hypothetical protein [Nitrosomonas sp.]